MTNVLLFAHRAADPLASMTGIGRYIIELTRALDAVAVDDMRFDVASAAEPQQPDWLPPRVRFRRVPGPRRAVHLAWLAVRRPRLERLVGEFDLAHALQPSFPLPTRRPAVMTLHDAIPLERPEWHSRLEREGQRAALRYAADHGWWFVADSEDAAKRVVAVSDVPADRVTVVRLGIEERFRTPLDPARITDVCSRWAVEPGRYLLTVGNVSSRKNVGTLIHALGKVDDRSLRLLLAGRVHESGARVLDDIERLGLGDRVLVGGFVPDGDLPALMQGALALAHPSFDEGFGFPPLEAMASGVPVVAARAGSVPEMVGDDAVLVAPADADAWAEAITALAGDADRRTQLAQTGAARAATFTWDRTAKETIEVYRRLLDS